MNNAYDWLRARVLGGISSINGMIYTRGMPIDCDRWAALGCEGWGWRDVPSYFKRSECNVRLAEDEFRGGRGPLHVADTRLTNTFDHHFLSAAEAAGFFCNPDFNGAVQEGIGLYQCTTHNDERWNAACADLHGGNPRSINGDRENLNVLAAIRMRR